jgi:CRP-like cAMP-binding protein
METLLRVIRQLIVLDEEEESIVSRLFTSRRLAAGEYFLEEGRTCRHVGFIEKGLVRYYLNVDGQEKTMYFNREGEFRKRLCRARQLQMLSIYIRLSVEVHLIFLKMS